MKLQPANTKMLFQIILKKRKNAPSASVWQILKKCPDNLQALLLSILLQNKIYQSGLAIMFLQATEQEPLWLYPRMTAEIMLLQNISICPLLKLFQVAILQTKPMIQKTVL